MRKRIFQFVLVALAAGVLLLAGCSDFEEMKSKKMLGQAESLIEKGNEEQAEKILIDLVARYPETPSGEMASKQLSRIQQRREVRARQDFAKILDSYQSVLNGYHALYAEYPRSVSALDQSGYFFDADYLEEITPEGYQVFLWLAADGSGYRAWCVSPKRERGYAVETSNHRLTSFNPDELLERIKVRFQTTTWDGKLVALQEQK